MNGLEEMTAKAIATARVEPRVNLGVSADGTLVLQLGGSWRLARGLPTTAVVEQRLAAGAQPRRLKLDASELGAWDSGFLAFLTSLAELCGARGIELDPSDLPEGARRLLKLAMAVPERQDARRKEKHPDFLTLVGNESQRLWRAGGDMLNFLGEAVQSLLRLMAGRARFRWSDLIDIVYECGAAALPIVTLISFLVGLILAFVGAVQLKQFGAQIYVADLVGIAMAREMGALMTAIIMSGRTGAAFAAQLGTMQVNEEIDALTTFGLSAVDFLVLPRMVAFVLMMPLLAIYAILLGLLGGAVVGVGMLGLSVTQYVNETINGVHLVDLAIGLTKASVFGILVALSGCLRGIQCGRSASAVGQAATSAVVTAIVYIIVTDGIFAVVTDALGI